MRLRWLTLKLIVRLMSLVMISVDADLKVDENRREYATEVKLFGRWSYEGIVCKDLSLMAYINMRTQKA